MQLEIGISTSRYLPASGTAGLARSRVRGNKRVPWPPPMMMESTLLALADMRALSNIAKSFLADAVLLLYPVPAVERKRQPASGPPRLIRGTMSCPKQFDNVGRASTFRGSGHSPQCYGGRV